MPPKGSKKTAAPKAKRQRTCGKTSAPESVPIEGDEGTLCIPKTTTCKLFWNQVWKMKGILSYRKSDKCKKAYVILLMKYIHMICEIKMQRQPKKRRRKQRRPLQSLIC